MFKPKTFLDLCFAMKTRAVVQIDQYIGTVNAIEAEDGSGHSWNVRMMSTTITPGNVNGSQNVYFRESV